MHLHVLAMPHPEGLITSKQRHMQATHQLTNAETLFRGNQPTSQPCFQVYSSLVACLVAVRLLHFRPAELPPVRPVWRLPLREGRECSLVGHVIFLGSGISSTVFFGMKSSTHLQPNVSLFLSRCLDPGLLSRGSSSSVLLNPWCLKTCRGCDLAGRLLLAY